MKMISTTILFLLVTALSFGQIKDFKKELIGTWDAQFYNSFEANGMLIPSISDANAKMVFTTDRVTVTGKVNWKGSWSMIVRDDEDGHNDYLQIHWDNKDNPEDIINLWVVHNKANEDLIVKGTWYDNTAIELMIGLKRPAKKK